LKSPAYIGLVNSIGRGVQRAGISWPKLNADKLIYKAQRRTGLDDFGDEAFREGLDKLVEALNEEAELSQVGRIAAHYNLLDYLCVRLKLVDRRQQRPDIPAQRIAPPLVILGLPRTGTTILYELIAQDPAFRSPASWEVSQPDPPPHRDSYLADPRISSNGRMLSWLERLTPGFNAIHAIGAQLPQECVYMLASQFASEQFSYMYHVPAYRDWLLAQDMTRAYQWHGQFLQHLQVDYSADRWLLKAPTHLANLKYLAAQYPDVSIVWTHRRPLEAVASFSSLVTRLRAGFSDEVDPWVAGQGELQHSAQVLQRGMLDRESLASGQVYDASFSKICSDPLAVVANIYAHFGWSLDADARSRMEVYLRKRPRYLYGKHHYTSGDYGLSTEQEAPLFDAYLKRHEADLC
jgi:Sulfotransferase family